ncbi:putative coatomer subunit beta' [Araneus ventricosus]|uniref:Putative coatomer subunit beta n=1 Tax=Araneus ventricosus TaxID=182803 RepID=A0A4Y2AFY2_ARAVE|nr:putative coatomer subunit beta' [Araneus ventricosus]
MPLKLDVKRKLLARSDRVKCVDLHPSEPWMLASLYNGNIHVWNYEIPGDASQCTMQQFPMLIALEDCCFAVTSSSSGKLSSITSCCETQCNSISSSVFSSWLALPQDHPHQCYPPPVP